MGSFFGFVINVRTMIIVGFQRKKKTCLIIIELDTKFQHYQEISISYIKLDVNGKIEPYIHPLIKRFERNSIHRRLNKMQVQIYLYGRGRRG